MSNLYNMLNKIKQQPLIYLGEKNLRFLRAFIDGYLECEIENNILDSITSFEKFKKYVRRRYDITDSIDYCSIINIYSTTEEEAFDNFFAILDDFFQTT